MAISKPSWLRQALDRLNWDIFTWKIYVGDAIERAIDWALGWLNWGVELAQGAYNQAINAWDKAVEVFWDLRSLLFTEVTKVTNKISTWWSDLGDWWAAKSRDVRDWIDAAKTTLGERIDDARDLINRVDTAWGNFRRDTLPNLLDTHWIRSFFGARVSSISDWWAPKKQEIDEQIETEVAPVRDEVNRHSSWLDLVKELFTDPEKFLLDLLERMLARFW